jgi:hypothetical protein
MVIDKFFGQSVCELLVLGFGWDDILSLIVVVIIFVDD